MGLRESLAQLRSPPRPNAVAWLWLSLVVMVIDQATKWLAVARLLRPVEPGTTSGSPSVPA